MQSLFVGALLLSAPLAALSQQATASPVVTAATAAAPASVVPTAAVANNATVGTSVPVNATRAAGTVATDASPAMAPAAATAKPKPTCIDLTTALQAPSFSSFVAAANYTELLEEATMLENSTFFIPSNQAFAATLEALNATRVQQLPKHILQNIILAHVVMGEEIMATDVPMNGAVTVPSVVGEEHLHGCPANISATMMNGQVMVMSGNSSMAAVINSLQTCQGIVHEINAVLIPCNLSALNATAMAPAPAPAHTTAHSPSSPTVTVSSPSSGPTTIVVNGPASAPSSSTGPVAQSPRSAAGALSAVNIVALFAAAIASVALF